MNFSEALIKKVYVHFVGNKVQDSGIVLSKKAVPLDTDARLVLKDSLLSPFVNCEEFFHFAHPSSLKYNEVYGFIKEAFNEETSLNKVSADIAQHLYECSTHPKIKSGELLVISFDNCVYEGKSTQAIGIFKIESKEHYIKFGQDSSNISFELDSGVDIKRGVLKACLVINTNQRDGYKICLIDSNNKLDTQYWKEDFLHVETCVDSFHVTENYLKVCKQFVEQKLPEEFEISKADQINYLNKSMQYFKAATNFEEKQFTKEVFSDPSLIKSFKEFKSEYTEKHELPIEDDFEVSRTAVKKQNRIFKSVLKLDSNFHIYIHGDRELIERGEEKNGRKFYKIYYDEEY